MMKVLVAILSCHSLRHLEQTLRETWLKDLPTDVDYKFFLGSRGGVHDSSFKPYAPDEVALSVDDSMQGLTKKLRLVATWAVCHGYDFMFKCDLDTLVRPRLLMSSGFERYDYTGGQNGFFASGGAGYCLSRKAMMLVAEDQRDQKQEEDVHTAQAVLDKGLVLHADPRFKFCPGALLTPDTITYHLSSIKGWSGRYEPQMMKDAYNLTGEYTPESSPRAVRFRRLR